MLAGIAVQLTDQTKKNDFYTGKLVDKNAKMSNYVAVAHR